MARLIHSCCHHSHCSAISFCLQGVDTRLVRLYDFRMSSTPPLIDTLSEQEWIDSLPAWDDDLEAQLEDEYARFIEERRFFNDLWQFPTGERLLLLRQAPPGPELIAELNQIDPKELDEPERLVLAHLWERCIGWTHARAAGVSASFADALEPPDSERPYTYMGEPVVTGAGLREIAVATGLSEAKTAMRVLAGRAFAPGARLAMTGFALTSGRISWEVASAFVDATLSLTDDQAREVEARVLPRAIAVIDPITGEGCWKTRAWAVQQLRRAVIAVDTDTITKQREAAQARRNISLRFEHDTGMAYLTAYLPAAEAIEMYNALTTMAEQQRRNDAATHPDERPRAWGTARVDTLIIAVRAALDSLAEAGELPVVHGRPRVELGVVIDLPTLLGMADHPAELLGYGPIDAEYARLLAADAEYWRRWVLEPVTGHLLDLGRTKYKPSQELRDYILAAYPECTKPECHRHSLFAQVDHAEEWHDDGPTSAANLHVLCQRDHTDKTTGWADARINPDGTVTHVTRNGLTRNSESYWKTMVDNITRDQDEQPPF